MRSRVERMMAPYRYWNKKEEVTANMVNVRLVAYYGFNDSIGDAGQIFTRLISLPDTPCAGDVLRLRGLTSTSYDFKLSSRHFTEGESFVSFLVTHPYSLKPENFSFTLFAAADEEKED
jgi:hypothetical protein